MIYRKVVITGGNGVLGTKLIAHGLAQYKILSIDLQSECLNQYLGDFAYASADITKADTIRGIWSDFQPDLVIHAAAFTDVDGAEEQKELCSAVNVQGTANVAAAAREQAAKLVYVSTDYVFDGRAGPYSEDDEPNPLGWYGFTKHEGEKAAREETANLLVCRTMGLYGFAPHIKKFNFVGWLIDNLRHARQVKVLTDQMVNHTIADDLARVIFFLAEHNASGIFHAAGPDRISRYDFALRVAEFFDFPEELLVPVSSEELGLKATRPLNGGLKMDKLAKHLTMLDTAAQLQLIRDTFVW